MKTLNLPQKRPSMVKRARVNAPSSSRRKLYLAIAAQLLTITTPAWAGPEGGVVVGGSGSIEHSDLNTTVIQNTDRLAVDWNRFDVGADERVTFIQPTHDSVALNRILGGNASNILGQIEANGHVVLINPNGILFGEGATINVGGLIASGLSVDPSDFMNGDFALKAIEGSEGAVINAGIINASAGGNVALIGQSVDNQGLISAQLGSVTLAAGKETIVSFDSKGLLGVKVTQEVLQKQIGVNAALQNSGNIQAEGGRVLLTSSVSQDIFTQAVNAGELNAKSSVVMHDDGSFTLGGGADVVNTGVIDVSGNNAVAGRVVVLGENITHAGSILADNRNSASSSVAGSIELHSANTTFLTKTSEVSASAIESGSGGDVKILGDKVALLDRARVTATGADGGGSILVGGDQRGENPLVRNAEFIYVSENSAIDASAIDKGDGGRLIAFAADSARIYGDLAARGGTHTGDGGFIETSGLRGFEIETAPDASAENGKAGTWLIDPYDITITAFNPGSPDLAAQVIIDVDNVFTSSDDGTNIHALIHPGTLISALSAGTTVIVQTGEGDSGLGDISIDADINLTSEVTSTLNFIAHNRVNLNANIVAELGTLNLGFNAAEIALTSGSNIDTGGGNIDITTTGGNQDNAVSASIDTGGGNFTATFIGDYNNQKAGATILTQGGNIDITTSQYFSGALSSFDTTGGAGLGTVDLKSTADSVLIPTIAAKGDIYIEANQGSIIADTDSNLDAGADVALSAGTEINLAGRLTSSNTININAPNLVIDGDIQGASSVDMALLVVSGNDSANTFTVNPNASFLNIDPASSINLGDGTDVINISASIPISIDAGAGSDTFNILQDNLNLDLLTGGSGDDTISMAETFADHDWTIGEGGPGDRIFKVADFADIENLEGGAGVDSFNTYNIEVVTSIDGGGGSQNSLNAMTTTLESELNPSGVIINLKTSTLYSFADDASRNVFTFSNISRFTSDVISPPEYYAGHLIADDQNYDWIFSTDVTSGLFSFEINNLELISENGQSLFFQGITTFEAGTGVDTLDTSQLTTDFNWSVNADNAGIANGGRQNLAIDAFDFSGFENLRTGNGINTINIGADVSIGNIQTGAGDDIISFGPRASAESLLTGAGADSVTLADSVNITGVLDGGAGSDTLDISAFTSAVELNFLDGTSSIGLQNQNFETEMLPAAHTTLFGGDLKTEWLLQDDNTLKVTAYNTDDSIFKTNTTALDFIRLRGGNGENIFQLASNQNFDGEIQAAAAGTNTLSGSDLINNWVIDGQNSGSVQAEGELTTTLFSNIPTLIGGGGNDSFEIVAGGSVTGFIEGGAGSDTLFINNDINSTWYLGEDLDFDRLDQVDPLAQFRGIEGITGSSKVDVFNIYEGATDVLTIDGGVLLSVGNPNMIVSFEYTPVVNLETSEIGHFQNGSPATETIKFSRINTFLSGDYIGENSGPENGLVIGFDSDSIWQLQQETSAVSGSITANGEQVFIWGNFNYQGGSGENTIIGYEAEQAQVWNINQDAGGYLDLTDGTDRTLEFSNFDKLVGSASDDVFNVSAQIGNISGGGGSDRLLSSLQVDQQWQLNTSSGSITANGLNVAFDGIQQVYAEGLDTNVVFYLNDLASEVDSIGASLTTLSTLSFANLSATTLDLNNIGRQVIGIDTFEGNGADSQLIGPNIDTLWLANSDDGSLVTVTAGRGVNFTNFESFIAGSAIDTLASTSDDSAWAITGTNSGTLNGSFDFSGIEVISGGLGSDTFTFSDSASIRQVLGNDGNDSFILANNISVDLLDGGAGDNSISAQNTADNRWLIDGADSGSLTTADTTTLFKQMATLLGSDSQNVFEIVTGGSVSGSILGGIGFNDGLIVSDNSVTNIWNLGVENDNSVGSVNSFHNIEYLVGNANPDTFNIDLNTEVRNIDGGLGNNTLTGLQSITIYDINSSTLSFYDPVNDVNPGAEVVFDNISTFKAVFGDPNAPTIGGFLVGADAENAWTIESIGALGSVTGKISSEGNTQSFQGMTSLAGGFGQDTLTSTQQDQNTIWSLNTDNTGSIAFVDGSVTIDSFEVLIGSAVDDTFNIFSSNIQTVDGGAGNNIFVGADKVNRWDITQDNGGLINDTLFSNIQTIVGGNQQDTVYVYEGMAIADIKTNDGDDFVTLGEGAVAQNILTGVGADSVTLLDLVSVSGIIDGGEGIDSIDMGAFSSAIELNFLTGITSNGLQSLNFETEILPLQGSSLFGGDLNTDWEFLEGSSIKVTAYNDDGSVFKTDTLNSAYALMRGGSGDNHFILAPGENTASVIQADANANNTLTGSDLINNWIIDGVNSGQLQAQGSSVATVFNNIGNLIGGSENDTFTISVGGLVSQIDAGGQPSSNDHLTFDQSLTTTWSLGAGDDQVSFANSNLRFSGINSIDGSLGDDTFNILGTSLLAELNARDGRDRLDITALSSTSVVNLQTQNAAGFSVLGFEEFSAEPSLDNQFIGLDEQATWTLSNNESGQISYQNGTTQISYTGFSSVQGGADADTFIVEANTTLKDIYGGAGNDTFNIGADSTADNLYGEAGDDRFVIAPRLNLNGVIDAGSAGETDGDTLDLQQYQVNSTSFDIQALVGFAYNNFEVVFEPTNDGSYFGGNGTNFWYITGEDEGRLEVVDGENVGSYSFSGIHTLRGGTGEDTFIFESDSAAITQVIEGGNGSTNNTLDLSAQDLVNQWILDGQNSGQVANSANPSGNIFTNIASIIGGSGDDVFTIVNATALPTRINGGLGNDSLNLQNLAQALTIALDAQAQGPANTRLQVSNINTVEGNANQNHHIVGASDQGYTWIIDNLNTGSVTTSIADPNSQNLRFRNIAAVIGGANDDIFQVTAKTNISLDGGAAINADFVDYSQVNANLSINLADSLNGESGVITGIEGIRGNNSGINDINTAELIGSNTNNVWTIADFDGEGVADGVNDGQFYNGSETISFIDFNVLRGGINTDTFNQTAGVIQGRIEGGAGNDKLNITLASNGVDAINNRGTLFIGGADNDTLTITGGTTALETVYSATATGGEFVFSEFGTDYALSHDAVEFINEQTLARTLEIRGSNSADNLELASGSFAFNQLAPVNYSGKDNLVIRTDTNDTVELVENVLLAGNFTLINAKLVTYDSGNTSITAKELLLDGTQSIGASTSRIRTNIDNIHVSDTQGDIYLQEQNGLNISQFDTDSAFDVSLLRGDLTSTAALVSDRRFSASAEDGNITLNQQNLLTSDITLNASDIVTLNSDVTIKLAGVNAETLLLQSAQNIEQTGPITVSEYTYLESGNDIILDNANNDFNRISILAAGDATIVDQNQLLLFGVSVDGHLKIKSAGLNIDNSVTANTLELDGGTGSVVMTNESSVKVEGRVAVKAEQDIVVSNITSKDEVNIDSSKGGVVDGNGTGDNITAKQLVVNASEGVGIADAIETQVEVVNINTDKGNVVISNTGDAAVEGLTTSDGNIDFNSTGNIGVAQGAVKASGDNKGQVKLGSDTGDVKQTGSSSAPAITATNVAISAPKGDFGAGGFNIEAQRVTVKAQKQVGELITPPGTTRDAQFSGTFKFEDQLLVIENFEDVSPAIFSNVKGYFYNDISLKLSADQLYDDEDDAE